MQVFVLGMHRSGTSVVTRMLNLMGLYFGAEGKSTGANEENPKGFWERRDIRDLNDALLFSVKADWNRVADFHFDQIPEDAKKRFFSEAGKVLLEMDAHRPWVVKEPRFCLLFPMWQHLLEVPVYVYVYRSPIQIAQSLQKRNGFPLSFSLALWEKYTVETLRAMRNLPGILVKHEAMLADPIATTKTLYAQLQALGVNALHLPSEREILAFIDPSLFHQHGAEDLQQDIISTAQQRLDQALLTAIEANSLENLPEFELSAGAIEILQSQEKIWDLSAEFEAYRQAQEEKQQAYRQAQEEKQQAYRQAQEEKQQALEAVNIKQSQQLTEKNQLLVQKDQTLKQLQQTQTQLQNTGQKLQQENQQQLDALRIHDRHLNHTRRLMRHLISDTEAVFNSVSWKAGRGLVNLAERLLLRQPSLGAQQHITEIAEEFRNLSREKVHYGLEQTLSGTKKPLVGLQNLQQLPSIDVVVCIHNALEDVKNCLASIIENTIEPYALYLVNDGSEAPTTEFLKTFCQQHPGTVLLENASAQGYTKAANKGLRASKADYVVLLNSDTIVPRLWLSHLVACGQSRQEIGIIGALSNAASWQSVPERFAENGDWAVNELPEGFTVNDMAELVYQASAFQFPIVPIVNGFCFAVKRALIDKIGYLDEENFPKGYGEENDYCLRAGDAGFKLAIADQLYVYHAKSKSYSHERRAVLAKAGDSALKNKHGEDKVKSLTQNLRQNPVLSGMRERLNSWLSGKALPQAQNAWRILFVLPVGGVAGGIHSIVQECAGMRSLGVDARIATMAENAGEYARYYPELYKEDLFFFYRNQNHLYQEAAQMHVLVATVWSSPRLLAPVFKKYPDIVAAYYVQDYEPWFFTNIRPDKLKIALESYTLIPNMCLFAKTDWLCQTVDELHQVKMHKVSPGLDRIIFHPPASLPGTEQIRIVAMIRPATPRRGAGKTMSVLKHISQTYGDKVGIDLFGCQDKALQELEHDFAYRNHGILTREEVAALYHQAHIFIDFSDYQAFGRTGLESMACGCVPILPEKGGVHEYAKDKSNALIVDTRNQKVLQTALISLIDDKSLFQQLREQALNTAKNYSVPRAALSELAIFHLMLAKQARQAKPVVRNDKLAAYNSPDWNNAPHKLHLSLLVAVQRGGMPTGSASIRLLQPLLHKSVKDQLCLQVFTDPKDLLSVDTGIIVIQRATLPHPDFVKKLVGHCQQKGLKLVLEMDDDLLNLHHKKAKDVTYRADNINALEALAKAADRIVVSSEQLKQTMSAYNQDVVSVPNAHDEKIWLQAAGNSFSRPQPARNASDPIRILYMGTKTHERDLKEITKAWQQLKKDYASSQTNIELDIIGGISDTNQSFQKFANILKIEGISSKDDAYLKFVQWFRRNNRWDFGIIPLEQTPFNRSKSYIKYLDYAALGIPAICSDITPYRAVVRDGDNGFLVKNTTKAWYQAMKSLIEDEALREKLAQNAFATLEEKHILKHCASDFVAAYQGLQNQAMQTLGAPFSFNQTLVIPSDVKAFVKQYLSGTGVEIGALHAPFPINDQTQMLYVDRMDTPSLQKQYASHQNVAKEKIVNVSIISNGDDLSALEDNSVDFVCNSHLIEHLANPGRAIEEWLRVVKPGGIVYMIVPDKRECFDRERAVTPLSELKEKYSQKTTQVSLNNYADYFKNVKNITDSAHIQTAFENQQNIHVHTWTDESFQIFLNWLSTQISFKVNTMDRNGLNITAVLQKI
ncbi:glycosyltransferase [Candidatus Venteria ishoeyi]|uniref:N-glycosyltransferase n=1 Tax=Candidatus Venteria ishoeyi TaxID=1899563 RepID=A0A1H6FEY8_9GAMM|nr:glycosyltransferase [Candidatus Venteria ishoeyi]SEH07736.1 N-glycosyltransferase [Candidatus Venteria ishoeyi]